MSSKKLASQKMGKIFRFVTIVCLFSALILSVLASSLQNAQKKAKEADRSKQLLLAAKILSPEGYFLLEKSPGHFIPAQFENNQLIPSSKEEKASQKEILTLYKNWILPRLTDDKGTLYTFEELQIDRQSYLDKHKKTGYAHLPYKLLYLISPTTKDLPSSKPKGYVIPINGFGLWGPIYGYLAIGENGDQVIGATWYDQTETAGLGAEIASPKWQKQFWDKQIFQMASDGMTNYERAPLGITVVKGQVSEVLGSSPKAKSAVDGISGASLTGQGVTAAYQNSLAPYRNFLIQVHSSSSLAENLLPWYTD